MRKQCFTKTLAGKTITVEVRETETFWELKLHIWRQEGILPILQLIIFAGKQMEDRRKLSDYNWKEDHLDLVQRLRSGGREVPINEMEVEERIRVAVRRGDVQALHSFPQHLLVRPIICAALTEAVELGEKGAVQFLLGCNADVEAKLHGFTALQLASQLGRDEIAQLLLDSRASTDARDDQGHAPLHWAAWGPLPCAPPPAES
jgi:hypothetical protein